ncbi:unnamed protein product [Prorocentrum cordatum]|uniref:Uncharacterized protein n=1 Tax=Prorocentrum cordatum TaxID=2364126 RepID=A0ABN9TYF7_9DINO|nr:unnamed protein product [Polarella glacialis]
MGPAGSDAAEARAPRPLAVDGGGAQHKTNSRGPRRGLGAQVPRRRGGEAGRGQTPSRGDGITAGFWSRYLTTGVNPRRRGSGERGRLRLRPVSAPPHLGSIGLFRPSAPLGFGPCRLPSAPALARLGPGPSRHAPRPNNAPRRNNRAEAARGRGRTRPTEPQRAAGAATGPSSGGEERAPRPRRRGPRGSPPEPPAAAPCPGARGHLCGAAGPRHAAPATRPRRGGPRRGTAEAAVCGAVRGRAGSVGLVPAVRSCSCRQRLTARAPAAPPRGCWPASGRA